MGEVDIRIVGSRSAVEVAAEIIQTELAPYIITTEEKELEDVVVQLLTAKRSDAGDRRIVYWRIAGQPRDQCSRIFGRVYRR